MIGRSFRRVFMVIAGVALWAIPTMASAHAGNNDPNVVHACIGNLSKIARIVGVSGSCISAPAAVAETPAHWNIQGLNGTDGTSVTFVGYFAGNHNGCANGGLIYAAGNPPVNAYVCNGTNGIDGEDGTTGARAAGPCVDNTNRYVDCGNGTVTDTVTGLIWLKQADCLANNDWAAANLAAAGLKDGDCGLTDGSSAGDWRLPTKAEWEATIARAVALGCVALGSGGPPALTNDAGTACYGTGIGSSFTGVSLGHHWSSTSIETFPIGSCAAHLEFFLVHSFFGKTQELHVWPVRGGPR